MQLNPNDTNILVLVSGNGTNLQALIDAAQRGALGGGRLSAVLSDRADVFALERARRAGLPALVETPDKTLPRKARRRDLSDRILRLCHERNISLIVLAGFLSILEGAIISEYEGRVINLHPSLLPKFGGDGMYGERVHQAALDAGERESGCTVHLVDAGTDTGPIILQRVVAVFADDTPQSLAERVHQEEHVAIVEATAIMAARISRGDEYSSLSLHNRSIKMKKRALISVYDKAGVAELGAFLVNKGWELLSTGGTAKYLQEQNLPVTDVAAITGFPECLDGRVKTLHPAVHAGLLAKRDKASHMKTLEQQGFGAIDLVCVNLYPFFEKVRDSLSTDETVEFIDIGGPAMLRSAAKNFKDVLVVTDPADYAELIAGLKVGNTVLSYRRKLAGKVFALTSAYDAAIARYLLDLGGADNGIAEYPAYWPMSLKKDQSLRYGENSHQSAALYANADTKGALPSMMQLGGKELSYNNIRDLDLAWKAACAFGLPTDETLPQGDDDVARLLPAFRKPDAVCCVVVKHNTPCGIALGATLSEACAKAYACDPVSIFGGILACNTVMDTETATQLAELFLEIVVAPVFYGDALTILRKKKNLRIMQSRIAPKQTRECISVDGGLLVQETNRRLIEKWEVVSKAQPEARDIADMLFGMRAVAYIKSNAIVVVKDQAAVGIGGGETNRISAAELALQRAKLVVGDGEPARVLASDAFFPFPDVVEAAAAAGIKTIVQPGGSIHDKLSVEACDKLGVAMVLTGTRHFKH
jgi:phosphoribosylaminoimidazolecarboxamide formyltransferase/IMP cyclohydrolase